MKPEVTNHDWKRKIPHPLFKLNPYLLKFSSFHLFLSTNSPSCGFKVSIGGIEKHGLTFSIER